MAVSYNKVIIGAGAFFGLMATGGILLGLGIGRQTNFGGHQWQIWTGSSLLSIGILGCSASLFYAHMTRHQNYVRKALEEDSRINIWAYGVYQRKKCIFRKSEGGIERTSNLKRIDELKGYTHVVTPLFQSY